MRGISGADINTPPSPHPTRRRGPSSLQHLPVNLFAAVMGVSGLCQAWRQASRQFGTSGWIDASVGGIAVAVFVLLCAAYAAKAMWHPQAVRDEFRHPIAGNFFGTVSIAEAKAALAAAGHPVR